MLFPNGMLCSACPSPGFVRPPIFRLRTTNGRNWVDIDGYLEPAAPVLVVLGMAVGLRQAYYVLTPRGLTWMCGEHLVSRKDHT